ncbi:MAG TPA: DUF5677 domain-containing protein [Candidatus Paceibacterota bacterium]
MELREVVQDSLLPLVQHVMSDALLDAELLRFDKTNPHQLYAVCIYGTILEIAHGCIVLLKEEQVTALPILLRSLLEAYADLRANVEDSEYYKNMYAAFLKEKLRLVKKAGKNQQNPYLVGLAQSLDIDTEKLHLEAEMEKYKKENRGPLESRERFEKGKLGYEFQSMYWLLCLHGHNNLSALEDRHIEKQDGEYNVILFKEEDSEDLVRYLDTLIATLIDSTERLHKLLETTTALSYQQHQGAFDAVRKLYSENNKA